MKKDVVKYGIIPVIIQIAILVICIMEFYFLIGEHNNAPLVVPSRFEGGEDTNPNIIRLVFMLVMIPLAFLFNHLAGKSEDNTLKSFWLAYIGGLFLWQSVGECSWHFMIPVEDFYVTFPRIESVSSTFMLLLAGIGTVAVFRHKAFNWSTRVFILSFVMNWASHFILIGTYPLVQHLMEESQWFLIDGIVCGGILSYISIYYMLKKCREPKEYLIASMLVYISLGIIAMGVRGG